MIDLRTLSKDEIKRLFRESLSSAGVDGFFNAPISSVFVSNDGRVVLIYFCKVKNKVRHCWLYNVYVIGAINPGTDKIIPLSMCYDDHECSVFDKSVSDHRLTIEELKTKFLCKK